MSQFMKSHPARHQSIVHPGLKYNPEEYDLKEEHNFLFEAGKLAASVRDAIGGMIKPGASIIDLCNRADEMIYSEKAKPAFPINISINNVAAHYSGEIADKLLIPDSGIVKVDCGVSINGFIADTAKSIDIDGRYKSMIQTTIDATNAALEFIRPGTNLGDLGGIIENVIRKNELTPVKGLRGHLIERYIVHAGKTVPNVATKTSQLVEEGEVYAIEPFVSNASGNIHPDFTKTNIFRAAPIKVKMRTKYAKKILTLAIHEFGGMPFAQRWLEKYNLTPPQIKLGIKELTRLGGIVEYNVLRAEEENSMVAQHEHTMIINEDSAKLTTK